MSRKELIKKQNGFSLIEIMVAFTILAVAFIGLAQAFPFGLSINKEAENTTEASYLAQDKIEELASSSYGDIDVGTIETKHRLSDDPSNYLYNYQREAVVSYTDGNLNEVGEDQGMKKISVNVYFINAISKTEKSYNISTIISEK
ncbi:MAG: prepilin-type N-terminal cleavage/methylation domain-containing protein [Patescibacteria group bacterium]|nr:prepilin-type N-terminal cleavage/methylation domain-containing protein [Patescibacteria group bacterium]MDD5294957.1 prepilin-type N-terminal cleavage/methylation domain-containing protein [Patescibacteria group bacterium]MDD5554223.1 prepilin-type N-terminal cleavage/methylation domain-containing protein [Patescibacteria group bacterium]